VKHNQVRDAAIERGVVSTQDVTAGVGLALVSTV
jgi:hypothetical protein